MVKYWKQSFVNGELKEGTSSMYTVEATDNIPAIKSISSSCGCSRPKYNKVEKKLEIYFKAGRVPLVRRGFGYYITKKRIVVFYVNGESDTLYLETKITTR